MTALPDAVAALIRSRRTIHRFRPDPPPRPVLLRALELGCRAPNHRLTEPWRFYLPGPGTRAALVRLNAEVVARKRGAAAGEAKRRRWEAIPDWFAVTSRRSEDALREREDYAATCCAVQNVMLYLWSEGLGVKWGTGAVTREAAFYDLFGIDMAVERVVGLFAWGYPDVVPETPRRPLTDVLVECP